MRNIERLSSGLNSEPEKPRNHWVVYNDEGYALKIFPRKQGHRATRFVEQIQKVTLRELSIGYMVVGNKYDVKERLVPGIRFRKRKVHGTTDKSHKFPYR